MYYPLQKNGPMRILHTSDWHLGKRLDFYSRFEEQKAVLDEIVQIAHEKGVDMVIVAGDLFDNFTPSNEAMELLYKTLNRLAKHGQVPVVAIAGNHDSPDRINVPDVFARENGVLFVGYPTDTVPLLSIEAGFSITKSDEGFVELQLPKYNYPIRLLHTAFANEVRLKECFTDDKESSLQTALAGRWKELATHHCDDKGVNILTTHLFVQEKGGQELEEPDGERPIKIGNAELLYSNIIPQEIQYAALGHLHSLQNVGQFQPVYYSGSILRYSFTEAYQQKYVVIADMEPGKKPVIETVPISGGKELERKTFDSVAKAVEWLRANEDVLVELTMETDEFLTAREHKEIHDVHNGIIFLIPKVKNLQSSENSAKEIDLTKDITTLFREYFVSAKKQEPNEEIMNLFKEILESQ